MESTEVGPRNAVQDSPEVAQENDIGSLKSEEKLNGKTPIAEPLKQNGNKIDPLKENNGALQAGNIAV